MDLLFQAFLPCALNYGIAFEAHGQNVLLRLSEQGELKGFMIRDFGGVKILASKLYQETGLSLEVLKDSYSLATTEREVLPSRVYLLE